MYIIKGRLFLVPLPLLKIYGLYFEKNTDGSFVTDAGGFPVIADENGVTGSAEGSLQAHLGTIGAGFPIEIPDDFDGAGEGEFERVRQKGFGTRRPRFDRRDPSARAGSDWCRSCRGLVG